LRGNAKEPQSKISGRKILKKGEKKKRYMWGRGRFRGRKNQARNLRKKEKVLCENCRLPRERAGTEKERFSKMKARTGRQKQLGGPKGGVPFKCWGRIWPSPS